MNNYTWRQSGLDARSHAFCAEDGSIPKILVELPGVIVPAECHVAACDTHLPVAYVMSQGSGKRCPQCTAVVNPRPQKHIIQSVADLAL